MRLEVVHGFVRLPAGYAVRTKVVTKTLTLCILPQLCEHWVRNPMALDFMRDTSLLGDAVRRTPKLSAR